MNTTLNRLTPAVMIAACLAALSLVQADAVAGPLPVPAYSATLPPVTVIGKRSEMKPALVYVATLPPVTVVGKRPSVAPATPATALRLARL